MDTFTTKSSKSCFLTVNPNLVTKVIFKENSNIPALKVLGDLDLDPTISSALSIKYGQAPQTPQPKKIQNIKSSSNGAQPNPKHEYQ